MSAAGREERILDEVTVDQPRSPVPARAWRALAVGSLGFGEHILGRRARNARRKQQRETARPGESAAKIGSR